MRNEGAGSDDGIESHSRCNGKANGKLTVRRESCPEWRWRCNAMVIVIK